MTAKSSASSSVKTLGGGAAQAGRFANTGDGPQLVPVDIGHKTHLALIDPDTAFWSLVRKGARVGAHFIQKTRRGQGLGQGVLAHQGPEGRVRLDERHMRLVADVHGDEPHSVAGVGEAARKGRPGCGTVRGHGYGFAFSLTRM